MKRDYPLNLYWGIVLLGVLVIAVGFFFSKDISGNYKPKNPRIVYSLVGKNFRIGVGIAKEITGTSPYEEVVHPDNYRSESLDKLIVYAQHYSVTAPEKLTIRWIDPGNDIKVCGNKSFDNIGWCTIWPAGKDGFLKGTHIFEIYVNDVDLIATIYLTIL